ncbi:hypothetical protein EW146_g4026 [Bondarzewia mesenterica]|uniref:Uncharacterized protein n=1 Tax=Bondarzewia mesenterica TaxID=1095465 RepID=A0A4S4LVR4_9AGAM|nr:hypothetical protein EW146_g4026 [Bondarzewia mesenterica]
MSTSTKITKSTKALGIALMIHLRVGPEPDMDSPKRWLEWYEGLCHVVKELNGARRKEGPMVFQLRKARENEEWALEQIEKHKDRGDRLRNLKALDMAPPNNQPEGSGLGRTFYVDTRLRERKGTRCKENGAACTRIAGLEGRRRACARISLGCSLVELGKKREAQDALETDIDTLPARYRHKRLKTITVPDVRVREDERVLPAGGKPGAHVANENPPDVRMQENDRDEPAGEKPGVQGVNENPPDVRMQEDDRAEPAGEKFGEHVEEAVHEKQSAGEEFRYSAEQKGKGKEQSPADEYYMYSRESYASFPFPAAQPRRKWADRDALVQLGNRIDEAMLVLVSVTCLPRAMHLSLRSSRITDLRTSIPAFLTGVPLTSVARLVERSDIILNKTSVQQLVEHRQLAPCSFSLAHPHHLNMARGNGGGGRSHSRTLSTPAVLRMVGLALAHRVLSSPSQCRESRATFPAHHFHAVHHVHSPSFQHGWSEMPRSKPGPAESLEHLTSVATRLITPTPAQTTPMGQEMTSSLDARHLDSASDLEPSGARGQDTLRPLTLPSIGREMVFSNTDLFTPDLLRAIAKQSPV